ncbi:hypothetical protein, partial [Thiolapillus sp.]|uniref:hypothetical protein n=1 Tax=Thiolapillus sp. TaxID=2017437 RepID=UPI003AF979F6
MGPQITQLSQYGRLEVIIQIAEKRQMLFSMFHVAPPVIFFFRYCSTSRTIRRAGQGIATTQQTNNTSPAIRLSYLKSFPRVCDNQRRHMFSRVPSAQLNPVPATPF